MPVNRSAAPADAQARCSWLDEGASFAPARRDTYAPLLDLSTYYVVMGSLVGPKVNLGLDEHRREPKVRRGEVSSGGDKAMGRRAGKPPDDDYGGVWHAVAETFGAARRRIARARLPAGSTPWSAQLS